MNIPYYSQKNITNEEWKDRACGVLCVAMVLGGLTKTVTPDELMDEGLKIGAYQEGLGWIHDGLAILLRNHGVLAYRQEFRSSNEAIQENFINIQQEKIKECIRRGAPVIASVFPGFRTNKDAHLIVIFAYKDGKFICNDPDAREVSGEGIEVVESELYKHLRPFTIFIEK